MIPTRVFKSTGVYLLTHGHGEDDIFEALFLCLTKRVASKNLHEIMIDAVVGLIFPFSCKRLFHPLHDRSFAYSVTCAGL